jgi:DNA-binding XRE family transcriptional regulator
MTSSFTDFMHEMAVEARQSGPEVEAAFFDTQQRHWIARLLFERRRELGFTQAKLAAMSGIDQGDISKIEHAEANPTLETLSVWIATRISPLGGLIATKL